LYLTWDIGRIWLRQKELTDVKMRDENERLMWNRVKWLWKVTAFAFIIGLLAMTVAMTRG
jgi:hypothetical protein